MRTQQTLGLLCDCELGFWAIVVNLKLSRNGAEMIDSYGIPGAAGMGLDTGAA